MILLFFRAFVVAIVCYLWQKQGLISNPAIFTSGGLFLNPNTAVMKALPALFLCLLAALPTAPAAANPEATAVPVAEEGAFPDGVTYTDGPAAHSKIITQETSRAVIDWQSFNIGKDAAVTFNQLAGSRSVTINRVTGGIDPTAIQGKLSANGTIVILDPNGVIFDAGAVIDVGGIVAATGRIGNELEFLNDKPLQLADIDADPSAKVVNRAAQFTVRDRGLAAFVAPSVQNSGIITARLGHVTLASGRAATLDFHGDRMVQITITEDLAAALPSGAVQIDNSGSIIAQGGTVQMTARAASAVIDSAINADGLVVATHAEETRDGKIILHEGKITLSDGKSADKVLSNSIRVGKKSRVQDAIDMAVNGTTVYVNKGEYKESLTIDKPLVLRAYDPNTAVAFFGTDMLPVISVTAPDVEINGIALMNGEHGIKAENADHLFVHNSSVMNSASHAVYLISTRPYNDIENDNILQPKSGKPVYFQPAFSGNTGLDDARIFYTPAFSGFGAAPLVIEQEGIDVTALAALAPAAGEDYCSDTADCAGN
mgnify:CR=1 FL=1